MKQQAEKVWLEEYSEANLATWEVARRPKVMRFMGVEPARTSLDPNTYP